VITGSVSNQSKLEYGLNMCDPFGLKVRNIKHTLVYFKRQFILISCN